MLKNAQNDFEEFIDIIINKSVKNFYDTHFTMIGKEKLLPLIKSACINFFCHFIDSISRFNDLEATVCYNYDEKNKNISLTNASDLCYKIWENVIPLYTDDYLLKMIENNEIYKEIIKEVNKNEN